MADNNASAGVLGSDAYSPAEIQDKVEKLGVKKARMPFPRPIAARPLIIKCGCFAGLSTSHRWAGRGWRFIFRPTVVFYSTAMASWSDVVRRRVMLTITFMIRST